MLNINIIKKIKISVLKVLTQIVCNQIIQIQQKYQFFGGQQVRKTIGTVLFKAI